MKTRTALLTVPIALLAATLSVALPNLGVELARTEELAQPETRAPGEKQPYRLL